MNNLFLQFKSTGGREWWLGAYSKLIGGKCALGTVETSKNQQGKKNMEAR